MQLSHLLGTGILIAAISVLARGDTAPANSSDRAARGPAAPAPLPAPPAADGHYALVVEGDRTGLAVTFASKKAAPWGGIPKGFESNWHVLVLDAAGDEITKVPLDVRPFATGANALGKPVRVHGCVVVDSKIGMLVNVPAYAAAASYVFQRADADNVVTQIGTTSAAVVRELARGGR